PAPHPSLPLPADPLPVAPLLAPPAPWVSSRLRKHEAAVTLTINKSAPVIAGRIVVPSLSFGDLGPEQPEIPARDARSLRRPRHAPPVLVQHTGDIAALQ